MAVARRPVLEVLSRVMRVLLPSRALQLQRFVDGLIDGCPASRPPCWRDTHLTRVLLFVGDVTVIFGVVHACICILVGLSRVSAIN